MKKTCKECNEIKSVTGFYANSKCADGYLNQCIDCVKAARKAKEFKVIEDDKKCSSCMNVKVYTEFNRSKMSKDGLNKECRECSTLRQAEFRKVTMLKVRNIPLFKVCIKCKCNKSNTEFSKASSSKDGLQHQCLDCKSQFRNSRSNPISVEVKECKECQLPKPASEFRRNKSSLDGLRHECKECRYSTDKNYRKDNQKKIKLSKKQYSIDNRELLNKKSVEKYHSDPKYRMKRNFYEQARRESQPHWALIYKAEWGEIYNTRLELEEITGLKHHIDHIIPVIHSKVCGLSVPWNYQVLPQSENVRKSNKFDGTYDNESWRNDL